MKGTEINYKLFDEWVVDELKKLDPSQIADALNVVFEACNYPDDMICRLDEETINNMFNTPYEALVKLGGNRVDEGLYYQIDGYGNIETFEEYYLRYMIEDYKTEIMRKLSLLEDFIDLQDYDFIGRILYIAKYSSGTFSERSLDYIANCEIDDFTIDDFDALEDDLDIVEKFEEYVEDKLSEEDED